MADTENKNIAYAAIIRIWKYQAVENSWLYLILIFLQMHCEVLDNLNTVFILK